MTSTLVVFPETDSLLFVNEFGENECVHKSAYVEPPCCNGSDCACSGLSTIICPAKDCTGITEADERILIEKLMWRY